MKYLFLVLTIVTVSCGHQRNFEGRSFKLVKVGLNDSKEIVLLQFKENNILEIATIREMVGDNNDYTFTSYSLANNTLYFQGKSFEISQTEEGYILFQKGSLSGRLVETRGEELNVKLQAELTK